MKADIPLQGEGTRLSPPVHHTPKAMMPLHGIPFIHQVINHLQLYIILKAISRRDNACIGENKGIKNSIITSNCIIQVNAIIENKVISYGYNSQN